MKKPKENIYDREAARSQREKDAIRVLSTLIMYGDGLIWTQQTLADVIRCGLDRIQEAVEYLTEHGYLTILGGQYKATIEGEEHYQAARRRYNLNLPAYTWKLEVLTGMDSMGGQTTIDRAVLTGKVAHPSHEHTPERLLAENEEQARRKQALCNRLGIELEEYERRIKDGSLKFCKGVDKFFPHVGIFDRRGGKKGGWQHLCRVCRKRLRERKQK